MRAMRVASWLVQVRPREGVFIVAFRLGIGWSPQPVKKRCWWSSASGYEVESKDSCCIRGTVMFPAATVAVDVCDGEAA